MMVEGSLIALVVIAVTFLVIYVGKSSGARASAQKNNADYIKLKMSVIRPYLPAEVTEDEIAGYIICLLIQSSKDAQLSDQ